ncbi:hypothetical protein F5Y16DRAFT_66953 [Xylariaceae sp. FL0255]|nr:hypothetical protein F5Y16DRAFT_66953 [Xylariaceae sp. FL0255]
MGKREVANTRYSLSGVTVLTHTWVQSVLVNNMSNELTAQGVVLANGTEYKAREIIVSGGSYRSPQILMLSGIGPRALLEEHNDTLPVGHPHHGPLLNTRRVNWDPHSNSYINRNSRVQILKPNYLLNFQNFSFSS